METTHQYRYYISYLLDDLPVGAKFKPSVLHITILPWFALETEEAPFIKWFYKHFDGLKSFDVVADQRAMFGPKHDVPVSILSPKEDLLKLHRIALSWFGAVGARWAEKDPYVGEDFVPHISQRHGYVVEEGQTLHIYSLTLFRANRREDNIRQVVAKAIFNEKD